MSEAIRNRHRVKEFKGGLKPLNRLVRPVNALCNPQVKLGDTLKVDLSDDNLLFQFPRTLAGGGAAQMFKLRDVLDDYVIGRTWDGTTLGTVDTAIAKDPDNRLSLSAITVLGVGHTLTYSAGPSEAWTVATDTRFNKIRNDNDGITTETQRIVPPWRDQMLIMAIPAVTDVVDASSNPVTWLMVSPRQWAKVA